MFLGEYQHSLDAKGRVILPAKFRDQLFGGAVVAKGLDGCLCIYTAEEFERVAEAAREAARRSDRERQAARSLFAGAAEVVPDKQGRIPIPQPLRTYAGLGREVVLAGVFSRVEIWDTERWDERERIGEEELVSGEHTRDFGI
jgi:MraZ protein